jgi:hypothetical protein
MHFIQNIQISLISFGVKNLKAIYNVVPYGNPGTERVNEHPHLGGTEKPVDCSTSLISILFPSLDHVIVKW